MKLTCKLIIDKRKELWNKDHDIEKDKVFVEMVGKKFIEKSAQGKILRDEVQDHPEYLIEMVFKLVNKEQETVPFFLNAVQMELLGIINADIEL